MMPKLNFARRAISLAVIVLFTAAPPAAANMAPPGWGFVRVHNVLDAARFAPRADEAASTNRYHFFTWEGDEVEPGKRFHPPNRFPTPFFAVPAAYRKRWQDLMEANDGHAHGDDFLRAAREQIPGFAITVMPVGHDFTRASSPRQILERVHRVVAIEDGAIRFEVSERRFDADGRPIGRAALAMLGVAMLGLTGLVYRAVRRRRIEREEA